MSSDICVLTTFFNPYNSEARIKNFYKFLENISKSIDLECFYALEIISSKQKQQINNCKNLVLKNDSIIWQKEAGLNYLLKNLDLSKYSKVLVVDCDIVFDNYDWIKEAFVLLEKYHLCQCFRTIKYMNFNNTDVDSVIDGVVYGHLIKNKDAQYGNGGLAVGYNKDYLKHMNGFFEKSVVGGGDTLNILPFLYDCNLNLNIFDNLMLDTKTEYFEYLIKARSYIKENTSKNPCFFVDCNVNHLFHGNLSDRQYQKRHYNVNTHNYYDNFEKDNNGLIAYKKNSELRNCIENYFENRKENSQEEDPVVWCNVKHEVEKIENNKFMWLSEQNKFLFKNICEIKMFLEKTEEIQRCVLYADNSVVDVVFDEKNQAEITLKNPIKIEIFSDCFIPKSIGKNSDTRSLSVMLKKIEIKKEVNDSYIEYFLENIL